MHFRRFSSLLTSHRPALDANTLLLLQVVDGAIVERTGNGTVTTSGTVIIDTSTTQDGCGSIRNTAAGSTTAAGYVTVAAAASFAGDFTIEGWFRPLILTTNKTWLSSFPSTPSWQIQTWSVSSAFQVSVSGSRIWSVTSALATSNWYHFALVRTGGYLYCYLNGSRQGYYATSATFAWSGIMLGKGPNSDNVASPCCWENIRISDVARYTAAFTPPARFS
jgi:hypothetical protein